MFKPFNKMIQSQKKWFCLGCETPRAGTKVRSKVTDLAPADPPLVRSKVTDLAPADSPPDAAKVSPFP